MIKDTIAALSMERLELYNSLYSCGMVAEQQPEVVSRIQTIDAMLNEHTVHADFSIGRSLWEQRRAEMSNRTYQLPTHKNSTAKLGNGNARKH